LSLLQFQRPAGLEQANFDSNQHPWHYSFRNWPAEILFFELSIFYDV